MSLDFLWDKDDKAEGVKLNEGGDFVSSFTGHWTVSPMWRVWDSSGLDMGELGIKPDGVQSFNSGAFYYFRDAKYDDGVKLCKAVGLKFGPKQIWRWEMPVVDAIGMSEAAQQAFGPVMSLEVGIGAFGGKDRVELHMIALPSAVQAIALAGGLIKEPVYDYRKLNVDPVTDDFQNRMIGSDNEYDGAELWQARVKLWEALGESNPKAYTSGQGGKFDAKSDFMVEILKIMHKEGSRPWARLLRVPVPRVDAANKEGKHLTTMCVDKVWRTEADCRAEVEAEDTPVGGVAAASTNGLKPPKKWGANSANDWKEWLTDYLSEKGLAAKPVPLIVKALEEQAEELESQYACTVEEIVPWLPEVLK